MKKPMAIVGLNPEELEPLRLLVSLLRHPDANVGELARQALRYVRDTSSGQVLPVPRKRDNAS